MPAISTSTGGTSMKRQHPSGSKAKLWIALVIVGVIFLVLISSLSNPRPPTNRQPVTPTSGTIPSSPVIPSTPPVAARIVNPKILKQVEPEITQEARQAKFADVVSVSLIVDTDGHPSDIEIKNPPGLGLDENILDAVSRWRFEPGTKNGVPVPIKATITVHFKHFD